MMHLEWFAYEWAMRRRDASQDTAKRFAAWVDKNYFGDKSLAECWDSYKKRDWLSP